MCDRIQQKVVQETSYAINADILAEGGDGEYTFVHEMILNKDYNKEWEYTNPEKFKIDGCKVEIIPQYNMCDADPSLQGYVKSDFPVKCMFYAGNTVGEPKPSEYAQAIFEGKYTLGTATSGFEASFGETIFKTNFKEAPTAEDNSEQLSEKIGDKQTTVEVIDGKLLNMSDVCLQKGRCVISINTKSLYANETCVLTKPGMSNSHGELLRALQAKKEALQAAKQGKQAPAPVEKKEKKVEGRKARKQNPPPPPDEPENPDVDDELTPGRVYFNKPAKGEDGKPHLNLRYGFIVRETYFVNYVMSKRPITVSQA